MTFHLPALLVWVLPSSLRPPLRLFLNSFTTRFSTQASFGDFTFPWNAGKLWRMMMRLLISTVLLPGAAATARPEIASTTIAVDASFGVSVLNIGFLPFSDPIPTLSLATGNARDWTKRQWTSDRTGAGVR